MNKRRDNKGRILHFGEYQMPDGRYRFKYTDAFGKSVCVYSNRLDLHDPFPPGKKRTPSLREMEKQVQADLFNHIASNGGNLTVLDLVEKYISTKINVRPTTMTHYKTIINVIKNRFI